MYCLCMTTCVGIEEDLGLNTTSLKLGKLCHHGYNNAGKSFSPPPAPEYE